MPAYLFWAFYRIIQDSSKERGNAPLNALNLVQKTILIMVLLVVVGVVLDQILAHAFINAYANHSSNRVINSNS